MWLIASAVSSIVSGFSSTHPCWRFYKKHTGPISTPNSWSEPPMSTGAMSTIGSLAVFCVLYSNTVLPQLPFACCKRQKKKKFNNQLTFSLQWRTLHCSEMVNSILKNLLCLNVIMYVFMYDESTGHFSKLFFCWKPWEACKDFFLVIHFSSIFFSKSDLNCFPLAIDFFFFLYLNFLYFFQWIIVKKKNSGDKKRSVKLSETMFLQENFFFSFFLKNLFMFVCETV